QQGLLESRNGLHSEAVQDLEFAVKHGLRNTDVIYALGYSYFQMGQLDKAEVYLSQVPESQEDSYISAIAARGEIAKARGHSARGLALYGEAKRLGGSALYHVGKLDQRIQEIEPRPNARGPEPSPLSIPVKHLHGGLLHSSCSGTLTVDTTGIRYDSSDPDQ